MPENVVSTSLQSDFSFTKPLQYDRIGVLKMFCRGIAANNPRRVTNLLRRLVTMDTLPLHNQEGNPPYQMSLFDLIPQIEHVVENCSCEGKKCTKCLKLKCWSAFHKDKYAKDGYTYQCKPCREASTKAWMPSEQAIANRKARMKAYGETHKEEKKAYNQAYLKSHKEQIQAQRKIYRATHREEIAARLRRWHESRPEYKHQYNQAYWRKHSDRLKNQNKQYYRAHADRFKKLAREYELTHREEVRLRKRARREANFERYAARDRVYHAANRERYRLIMKAVKAKRRALIAQTGGSYTVTEWINLKSKYNHTCLCCGRCEPDIKLTADHVVPVTRGGHSNIDNIQPLCGSCNSKKHNKIIDYRPLWIKRDEV